MVKVRRATRRMTHKRRKTRGRKKVMRGGGCKQKDCIAREQNGSSTTYREHNYADDDNQPAVCNKCGQTRYDVEGTLCSDRRQHKFVRDIYCKRCACSYQVYV